MTYYTLPEDQGQFIHVEYALGDGVLIRRVTDRSLEPGLAGSVVLSASKLNYDGIETSFEPWNGILPAHGEFKPYKESEEEEEYESDDWAAE